jgi:hypothetical protein
MKKIFLYSVFLGLIFLASCTEEGSEPTAPVDDRDKFVGAWLCTEKIGTQNPRVFTIDISKVNANEVKIKNFSDYGDFTYALAEVIGNSLVIPQQNLTGGTPIAVQGSGIYSSSNGGKITVNYTVDGDSATATCVRP